MRIVRDLRSRMPCERRQRRREQTGTKPREQKSVGEDVELIAASNSNTHVFIESRRNSTVHYARLLSTSFERVYARRQRGW